jgi:antitoxin (DNA-binding transcriptional repressor) of toxin-antitoxin stability system
MHDAKTQLSRLAERAANGEEIVIARNGRPLAKLGPLGPPRRERRAGFLKGKIWVSDDFDDPLPWEIQRYFEGEDDD